MGSSKKRHGAGSATGKHGLKKQKLSSMSRELKTSTKKMHELRALIKTKETKLAEKKAGKREGSARIPYNRHMQYLTIGEGNFSFTHALVRHFIQQNAAAAAAPPTTTVTTTTATTTEEGGGEVTERKASKYKKKEGSFDPAVHVPFLAPNSLFLNPAVRVVATCYDSWKELLFKYPDVTTHLGALALHNIPIYAGVDCTKLEAARRTGRGPHGALRRITMDDIQAARKSELERKDENEAARKARRIKEDAIREAGGEEAQPEQEEEEGESEEDEQDAAAAATEKDLSMMDGLDSAVSASEAAADAATAALLAPASSPLLFPPFVTRRAFHTLQNAAEARLHGSQRKKFKERKGREQEEFKAEILEERTAAAAAAAPASSTPAAAAAAASSSAAAAATAGAPVKLPTASALKALHRAAQTSSSLLSLNRAPRTRFHRILFQFPHTGCGIKDTEANNEVHRQLLLAFLRNVVATRLVYPSTQHGEVHITLKKGEPYRSGWNLVQLARRVPGLSFKTSFEFYPALYPGYEHRRTRGFEDRVIDLNTGQALGPNADILANGLGAMTYVFVREPNVMDEEENKFDAAWIEKFSVARQEEDVRQQLIAECERIYKQTKQKYGQDAGESTAAAAAASSKDVDMDDDNEEEEEAEEEVGADENEDEEEEEAEEAAEEEDEDEDEESAETEEKDAAKDEEEAEEEEDDRPRLPTGFSLAAQLRQHFQPQAQAVAAVLAKKKPPPVVQPVARGKTPSTKKKNNKRK